MCVSEVEGISNVVRHCAKCEKPNPLTSTDAVAERARDVCTFAVRPVVSHSVIASSHLLEPIAIKLSPHDPYPVSMRSNRAFKGRKTDAATATARPPHSTGKVVTRYSVSKCRFRRHFCGRLSFNVTIVKFIHRQLGNFANCPLAHELI